MICDTREKAGFAYDFPESDMCKGTVRMGLPTGDYTMKGYEERLCIERKKTVSEIAINVHEDRFYRELERMQTFEWAYILCEFSIQQILDFPVGANLPPKVLKKVKVKGPYIMRRITEIMVKYNVPFVFCGNQYYAYLTCSAIMRRIHESET